MMIKHIVMFKFKKFAENNDKLANIQMTEEKLEALPAKINEIKFFEVGINFSDANVAYDLVLLSEFESKEALFTYQRHPEHIKVADFVHKVCESRIVVDYVF
jgi:Stress responsive A/B Barrel Domain